MGKHRTKRRDLYDMLSSVGAERFDKEAGEHYAEVKLTEDNVSFLEMLLPECYMQAHKRGTFEEGDTKRFVDFADSIMRVVDEKWVFVGLTWAFEDAHSLVMYFPIPGVLRVTESAVVSGYDTAELVEIDVLPMPENSPLI